MKVTGACHCGQIRYEAEINDNKVGICHCTDCQVLSGSAFRTIALTEEDGFQLLAGTLKEYIKTGESGKQRVQSFCPNCGSPIYSAAPDEKRRQYSIRVGTIHQKDQLEPKFQIWCRSSQKWLAEIETIKKIAKQ